MRLGFVNCAKNTVYGTVSPPLRITTNKYFVWFSVALLPQKSIVIHSHKNPIGTAYGDITAAVGVNWQDRDPDRDFP